MSISRRSFVIGSAAVGGGILLGINLRDGIPVPGLRDGSFQPNAFLQVTNNGDVIFQLPKTEMGQGLQTSLTTMVAEELDFEPEAITVEFAGAHPSFKDNVNGSQLTGGSNSIAVNWVPLREAGAAAKAMLVAAAAAQWGIDSAACSTEPGKVVNSNTGEQLAYGGLADAAKAYPDVSFALKARSEYRWLGKKAPRMDAQEKSTGTAHYGMDTHMPGMKTAVVVRPGQFGATLKRFDAELALQSKGVSEIFAIHTGVAVVAENYWQARKAAQLVVVEWEDGPLARLNSAGIRAGQEKALDNDTGHFVVESGDVAAAQSNTTEVISARYAAPYAHHSPMEPQNATVLVKDGHCEIWAPTQAPDIAQAVAAHYGNIPRDNIRVHSMTLGGGFGRRGYVDYVGEAVAIASHVAGTPVKLVWSREDDMQHDFYRPATLHEIAGTLNQQGDIDSWQHKIVSPSIIKGLGVMLASTMLPAWIPTKISRSIGRVGTELASGMDPTTAEGAKVAYQIPNVEVEQILHDPGVPIGFWRSVGFSHNCFVAESFCDELAYAADADPLAFRLKHLDDAPRYQAVLQLAAEKAGWGKPTPGRFQGLAVVEPFNSFCAAVVEISLQKDGYKVERVVNAVDCGFVLNPDIVTAQIESAVIYGLTAATKAPITIANGAVVQSNFHDAPVLRMNETPVIETFIVDSEEDPTGIGEIGLPAVAPALGNAIFAATGKRLRELPLLLS